MVTVIAAYEPRVVPPDGLESVTVKCSFPSTRLSVRIGMTIVFVVSLTPKVSVPVRAV
jgi:hypothetical protein